MQAVAQELVRRNHQVVWLTSADNEARVRATGAEFIATKAIAVIDEPLARAEDTGLLDSDYRRRGSRLLAQVADYHAVLKDFKPDVLLVDVMPYGARALKDLGEIPVYASLGVIPFYTSSAKAPHAVSGVPPPASLPGLFVNALQHFVKQWLILPLLLRPTLNQQRAILGLGNLPYGEPAEYFIYSPFLHIQASSSTLEFNLKPGSKQHAENTAFVGPLVAPANTKADSLPDWWLDVMSHPRVVAVTQGTLALNPTSLIIPSVQALSRDPKLLILVISPHADEVASVTGTPPNVRFAKWLPYHLLLPQLSLLITNGGYGSITQALSHKVPLLCAGQTEDKKDTAARVAWYGAGIDLKTDSPSPAQVEAAARRILEDESFQQKARELGDELNNLGGATTACDRLEELGKRYMGDAAGHLQ